MIPLDDIEEEIEEEIEQPIPKKKEKSDTSSKKSTEKRAPRTDYAKYRIEVEVGPETIHWSNYEGHPFSKESSLVIGPFTIWNDPKGTFLWGDKGEPGTIHICNEAGAFNHRDIEKLGMIVHQWNTGLGVSHSKERKAIDYYIHNKDTMEEAKPHRNYNGLSLLGVVPKFKDGK